MRRIEETLVLTLGVTISGRMRESPPTGLPLTVEARRLRARSWSLGPTSVFFLDGRPECASATASVDEEGSFVLEGLAPGPDLLRIESRLRARLHMHVSETHARKVAAPVEDVELDLVASRIMAEVRIDGRLVPNAHLMFIREGAVSRSTDAQGRATVWGVPGATYRVAVSGLRNRANVAREVRAPGPGEELVEVFDLPPRRTRATLLVTLRLPPGRYELTLTKDRYREKTISLLVEAGRTREVDVTLELE